MGLLTRETILSAQDLASQDVPVPEWGGSVRVRMLTGTERDQLGAAMVGADGKPDGKRYRLLLLAASLVGDDGRPMFGPDEVDLLGGKSGVALERVYRVAEALNDSSPAAMEAAEKNSGSGQNVGSSCDGPSLSVAPPANS